MQSSSSSPSDATVLSSAMALFDKGDYQEVLTIASGTTDPALMLLAARSYIATEKYDIAETLLRSLIKIMPNSSYLHGYLGDVLTLTKADGALDEYATALRLDPDNISAMRNYASILISRQDLRSAIPVFRAIVHAENKPEDLKTLEDIFIRIGEPNEAVSLHRQHFGTDNITVGYTEALLAAKEYQDCLNAAHTGWEKTNDTAYLRIGLEALAVLDPSAAEKTYKEILEGFNAQNNTSKNKKNSDKNVISMQFSYVLLEKLLGNYETAKQELQILLKNEMDAIFPLVAADIEHQLGNDDAANSIYRTLITKELTKDSEDTETTELIIDKFIAFLTEVRNKEEVAGIISVTLSPYPRSFCLAKIGEAYEVAGSNSQAKDWYFRAYRADYIKGGIAYAGYLKRIGEYREAESILRYIFTTIQKISELEQAADAVLNGTAELYHLDHTRELVLKKLSALADKLSSKGREMLAALYLYSAVDSLEKRNYEDGKWFCLAGIDVLPCYPKHIKIEDFTDLLLRAKGRALAERPILREKTTISNTTEIAKTDDDTQTDSDNHVEEIVPNLEDREKQILAFLREHGEATEMDLRTILTTHRVTGIVNALMEKLTDLGISLIEKRGTGERGEIYGYIGRR